MIILGVDPGTLSTGFGIIEVENGTYSVLAFNVIKNTVSSSLPLRLKRIYGHLSTMIDHYHPDEFAIETAFYGKNVQSALKIGHARGVSILAAVNHELPTTEYSPREVKKAVTGNGGASKEQVRFMVQSQLNLRETPKYFDISDALAVALCHSFRISGGKPTYRRLRHTASTGHRDWSEFVHAHPERVVRKK